MLTVKRKKGDKPEHLIMVETILSDYYGKVRHDQARHDQAEEEEDPFGGKGNKHVASEDDGPRQITRLYPTSRQKVKRRRPFSYLFLPPEQQAHFSPFSTFP